MKNFIINILLTGCIAYTANAQNTGFGGKRVLFKTNIVNGTYGFCNSYQAEVVLHRRMTLGIGYDLINTSVSQSYHAGETAYEKEISMSDKASTSYNGFNLEFRKYIFNDAPAPYGAFLSLAYGNGTLDIEKGSYSEDLFIQGNNKTINYSLTGINVNSYKLGFGYQKAINKWLFVGYNVSFNYFRFGDILEGVPNKAASGVLKNYGSNIWAFNFAQSDLDRSDGLPEAPSKNSFGISGAIQIGFIIF
jgi:hypothetical protein